MSWSIEVGSSTSFLFKFKMNNSVNGSFELIFSMNRFLLFHSLKNCLAHHYCFSFFFFFEVYLQLVLCPVHDFHFFYFVYYSHVKRSLYVQLLIKLRCSQVYSLQTGWLIKLSFSFLQQFNSLLQYSLDNSMETRLMKQRITASPCIWGAGKSKCLALSLINDLND